MDIEKRGDGSRAMELFYESLNDDLARYSTLALGCAAAVVFIWKLVFRFNEHLRRLASFGDERQRYFIPANETYSWFKNHLIYASLFRTRHNREIQLSSAINMGTLPSRLHGLLVGGIIAMNVALCVVSMPYGSKESTLAVLVRNRAGTMAVVNLMPMVLMAGRNNPLISLLRVPFDTWNLLHRWLGRIVVLEALTHVFAWAISKSQQGRLALGPAIPVVGPC